MTTPLPVSNRDARRLVLALQGLADPRHRALGIEAVAVDTMMTGDEGRARVARNVLVAAGFEP